MIEEKNFPCQSKQPCNKSDNKIPVLQGKQYLEARPDSLTKALESP